MRFQPNSIPHSTSASLSPQSNSNMMLLRVPYMFLNTKGIKAQTSILVSLFAHAPASQLVTSTLDHAWAIFQNYWLAAMLVHH